MFFSWDIGSADFLDEEYLYKVNILGIIYKLKGNQEFFHIFVESHKQKYFIESYKVNTGLEYTSLTIRKVDDFDFEKYNNQDTYAYFKLNTSKPIDGYQKIIDNFLPEHKKNIFYNDQFILFKDSFSPYCESKTYRGFIIGYETQIITKEELINICNQTSKKEINKNDEIER